MLQKLIELCGRHRKVVYLATALSCAFAALQATRTPLDALPDISDTQVIIASEWMGQSPTLIEQQVTYPLITTFLSAPKVKLVRGFTMVGMSFVYVVFEDGTDPTEARTSVLQYLPRIQGLLPAGVTPQLGPDATSLGWVFEYVLVDPTNRHSLVELRTFQDWVLRYWLAAVPGVAEVASIGGFVREFQIELDPVKSAAVGVGVAEVAEAVRGSNADVGGRVVEMSGHEYVVRGRGLIKDEAELRSAVIKVDARGVPVRLSDVAQVVVGGRLRRGLADLDGAQEVVGGIVIMRQGENALEVIDRVKEKIAEVESSFPEGVKLVPTYDRSGVILGSVRTLLDNLLLVMLVVIMTIALALLHLRSSLVPIIALPAATVLAFLPLKALDVTVNIMSLAGIIIAVGDMVDSAVVMIEESHRRLARGGAAREDVIIGVAKDLGPSLFGSLLVITVSFLPVFALQAQEGRLFKPLAMTKGFAMLFAAILGITLVPALMVTFIKGRIRPEEQNPMARVATALYRPVLRVALRHRWIVATLALLIVGSTIHPIRHLGSEFLPPLDEGDAFLMPITLPSISIAEARKLLQEQDRRVRAIPEVAQVFGKLGRAETATDPAPLSMFETVVRFKPREEWREGMTRQKLQQELEAAARLPGLQNAWTMPIKARVDMLSTGIRTAVGVKIHGSDLKEIARLAEESEGILRNIPGTRSVYAERELGGLFLDFKPDREAIARYGLRISDVLSIIDMGVGGMEVSTAFEGSSRIPIVVRYPRDVRQTIDALERTLVPISLPAAGPSTTVGAGMASMGSGMQGGSLPTTGGTLPRTLGASAGGMGGMGGAGGMSPSMGGGTGMGGMGGGGGQTSRPTTMAASGVRTPVASSAAPRGFVPLAQLGRFEIEPGPAMIKDEGGMLTGWVYVDVDESQRDIGSYVKEARAVLAEQLPLPPGYLLKFSGQYEFMERTAKRLTYVIPLTLLLIFIILFFNFRNAAQVLLVMASVPFAAVGSLWLLWAVKFNTSVAVWVGMIALLGVAAETASVMVIYLDEAYARWRQEGRLKSVNDLVEMGVEGAAPRVRPLLMTVGMNLLGLIPVLLDDDVGADMAKRIAAPMWGGLVTLTLLTLFVIPALYVIWRQHSLSAVTSTDKREVPASVTGQPRGV
ncbi:MAG: CusA/CzcA family heavy metal efflux RND transporter [Myxococcota bacterium]